MTACIGSPGGDYETDGDVPLLVMRPRNCRAAPQRPESDSAEACRAVDRIRARAGSVTVKHGLERCGMDKSQAEALGNLTTWASRTILHARVPSRPDFSPVTLQELQQIEVARVEAALDAIILEATETCGEPTSVAAITAALIPRVLKFVRNTPEPNL